MILYYRRKIEGTVRQRRRCKQLLDDLREERKYRELKGEEVDLTSWERLEDTMCA
jgi:hypothetical protein